VAKKKTKPNLKAELTLRQAEAWRALQDPGIREVLYGGAKGGGKSWLLVVWAYFYAWQVAHEHRLPKTEHPPHIGWIGRKQAADFVQTTLTTWQMVIPSHCYELRAATDRYPRHICIDHRVAIDYGGLDRQEAISKFNSAEYAFLALDQAEETTRDDVATLRASLRMRLGGKPMAYKTLWTANPAQCWLKEDFIDKEIPGHRFVRALPGDNPHLPEGYEQTLRAAFEHRPDLLEAYLHGSWQALSSADQIIKAEWLREAAGRTLISYPDRPRICCDTAGFGDDETVIYYSRKTDIDEAVFMPYTRTTEISSRLAAMSFKYDNCPIVVESTGGDLGQGVIDELVSQGKTVMKYCPQGKAERSESFGNMRAEAWSKAARMLSKGDVSCKNQDSLLVNQLCTPRYRFRSGKTWVESKEEIKARLGRSPDRADCYVMVLWSYDRVPVAEDIWLEDDTELAESYVFQSVL